MLFVIPHILKVEKYHSDSDYRKQVNNVIKTFFHGLSDDEMSVTQYIFWNYYIDFYNNNGSFDGYEFICKRKEISDGNIHFWHQK